MMNADNSTSNMLISSETKTTIGDKNAVPRSPGVLKQVSFIGGENQNNTRNVSNNATPLTPDREASFDSTSLAKPKTPLKMKEAEEEWKKIS